MMRFRRGRPEETAPRRGRAGTAPPPARTGDDAWVDAFVDRYVEWREECKGLDSAYGRWARSVRADRDLAFATYRAALDREEKAATDFGLVAARLGQAG